MADEGSDGTEAAEDAAESRAAENPSPAGAERRLSCGGIFQLFAACDLNGSGFLEAEELRTICNELTSEELADVFRQLDNDGDGKISLQEFADGFQVYAVCRIV